IEVLVALAILAIALMAVVSSLGSSSALRVEDRALNRALGELDERLERMRGMDPQAIIEEILDSTPADQPQATYTAVGDDLESGVEVCRNATLTIELLTEAQVAALLGVADVDLDGNGNVNNSAFRDYRGLAPVRLTYTWEPTPGGPPRTVTMWTIIYQRAG
ncbi:MAG: type II secretion system protein, partial [Planctomycetota bacterium]|nr:type II secretion system protein [Planctomycetota bacterium]